ncbi:MAG: sigma-54 dependent transcriptional regulator [Pseudomonadota bacterium]
MAQKTVLLAEDDASIRLVASQTLSSAGYTVRATASVDALERWVREGQGDVVVSDVYLGDTSIFERLSSLKLARPALPFVIMSAQNTILTAASAADHGAFDYLPKPFNIDDLVDVVSRALKSQKASPSLSPAHRRSTDENRLPLIGRSEAMQDIYRVITRVMNTDLTVLIDGEPGTGKDLAARAIHDLSGTSGAPFVHLDSGAVANSSADRDSFEPGTTLYLDEVGDFSPDAQARVLGLLRAQENLRVIASTRHNLSRLMEEGAFRDDLYFRLSVVRLTMPALRRRKEDIPELTRALFVKASEKDLPEKTLESSALDLLMAYDWPGNVRELENVVLRLCALSADPAITSKDVERELRSSSYADMPLEGGFEEELESLLKKHILGSLMSDNGEDGARVYQSVIDRVERPLIKLALQVSSGNKVRAAAMLGLNRNTLRAKINSLSIATD